MISWNMDFDWRLLVHMFKKYELDKPEVAGLSCAMDKYSEISTDVNIDERAKVIFKYSLLNCTLDSSSTITNNA